VVDAAKLLEGITPGPWEAQPADMFGDHNIVLSRMADDRRAVAAVVSNMRPEPEVAANARLIAAAPTLAAEVIALRAEVERLRALGEALSAAADEINGEIDAQTYDEKLKLRDWDDDQKWDVCISYGEERALNRAICAWQAHSRGVLASYRSADK